MSSFQVGATLLSLLKTFAIPLSLWVLRNGFAYYRDLKASYNRQKPAIRPLPLELSRALNVLFAFAVFAFVTTLPYYAPTNILALTNGRLQTTTDVLFNRLAALRPLTPIDISLRTKLNTRDGRLLYMQYGPYVLGGCTYCKLDEPNSFLVYALPLLLAPHLLHLVVVGLATSERLAGPGGARWRTPAVVTALAMAAIDLYSVASYDPALNTRALQTRDFDFFYWRMRSVRGLAFVVVDAGLAAVMWLAGTNRLLVQPFSTAERAAALGQALEKANFTLWAYSNVRNAGVRDPTLRNRAARYWADEARLYEEREVVDAMRGVLARTDMRQWEQAASTKADEIVGALG